MTQGHVTSNPLSAAEFLLALKWRICSESVKRRIDVKAKELDGGKLPGYVGRQHYRVVMDRAKALISEGKVDEADRLVTATFDAYE